MKTKSFSCAVALAVSLGTSFSYAQSVEELLGLTVPGMQSSTTPGDMGHVAAEESPFYFAITVDPVVQGDIHIQDSTTSTNLGVNGNQIKFFPGVGVGLTLGYRIPDTYIVVQVSTGFLWSQVREFNGTLDVSGATSKLSEGSGHLYQIPVLVSPGLEFDLGDNWPFLHGSLIRFGPTVGVTYYDLTVDDINRENSSTTYSFGRSNWAFAYGAFLSLDFFLTKNVALTIGYQFMGTASVNYGDLKSENGGQFVSGGPDMKANFTYVNIVKCGVSIYF